MEEIRAKFGIGRSTTEDLIRESWVDIVGPANAGYSHAVRIDERRRLVVHASHAVVRNELFMNREVILERIQALPGCAGVKALHLSQG